MTEISSLETAAGMFGITALVKVSTFAAAVAMLGLVTPAQAGELGQQCPSAQQNPWLSLEAMRSKVETLGYRVQKVEKNACGALRLLLEKSPKRA